MMRISKRLLALSMASTFALTSCGGATDETADEPTTAADAAAEDTTEDDMSQGMASEDDMDDDMASEEAMGDPAANLVGAGCVDYAEAVPDGAGSVEGRTQDRSPWRPATTPS